MQESGEWTMMMMMMMVDEFVLDMRIGMVIDDDMVGAVMMMMMMLMLVNACLYSQDTFNQGTS